MKNIIHPPTKDGSKENWNIGYKKGSIWIDTTFFFDGPPTFFVDTQREQVKKKVIVAYYPFDYVTKEKNDTILFLDYYNEFPNKRSNFGRIMNDIMRKELHPQYNIKLKSRGGIELSYEDFMKVYTKGSGTIEKLEAMGRLIRK